MGRIIMKKYCIIGKKIRYYREQKGFTQKQLAQITGISRQMIYQYENGMTIPKLYNAILLAKALEVSLDDLCSEVSPEYKEYLKTYKDLLEIVSLLDKNDFFAIDIVQENDVVKMIVQSKDETFIRSFTQLKHLLDMRDSLSKETFEKALKELLDSFNIAIIK